MDINVDLDLCGIKIAIGTVINLDSRFSSFPLSMP